MKKVEIYTNKKNQTQVRVDLEENNILFSDNQIFYEKNKDLDNIDDILYANVANLAIKEGFASNLEVKKLFNAF